MDQSTEPPSIHRIVFRSTVPELDIQYRIDRATLARIADDFQRGAASGAYDVETADGKPRKLMFHFADVLFIG